MPKLHGYKTRLFLNGRDISQFWNSADTNTGVDMADCTCFDGDGGHTSMPGLFSPGFRISGYYDGDASVAGQDDFLTQLLGLDSPRPFYAIAPDDRDGAKARGAEVNVASYGITQSLGGVIGAQVDLPVEGMMDELTVAFPRGTLITQGGTIGPDVASDIGAGKTLLAYLHIFQVTSGTPIVKLQQSATAGGIYSDLITFTGVTSPNISAQRGSVVTTLLPYKKVLVNGGACVCWVGYGIRYQF